MNVARRFFLKVAATLTAAFFANRLAARQNKLSYLTDPDNWFLRYEVPKTAAELYEAMSAALPVGESTVSRWSVTGEEYVEYALGLEFRNHDWNPHADYEWEKFEGYVVYRSMASPEGTEAALCSCAWRGFLRQLERLPRSENHVLYWRTKPDVGPGWKGVGRIYARYLISSKPALI